MNRALLLAATVGIGSFIQGWVYILLNGHPSYMKEQFNLEMEPERDGLVWVVSMIGILLAMSLNRIGRRPLLVFMSLLYLLCSVVMLWSGDITLLLVSRFVSGFTWGFSHILVAFYFIDVAPWGLWSISLPQLSSLCGVGLCLLVAKMPAANWLSWRIIFWVAFVLSVVYFILAGLYLPESPKWLVRKGLNVEATQVLQTLHGRKDVSDEMYSLVYGLRLGGATSIEALNGDDIECGRQDLSSDNLNKPVTLSSAPQQGSIESEKATLVDSLPTLSGNGKV